MIELKNKVAIYIRVSTHFQVDKDSLSVQRRELIYYAECILGITEYEVFEDAGFSAKNTDRPKFQEMMDRLRTGEFSHLLVWKIDRISRNLLDFTNMYLELKNLGVAFVSKNEQFDTSSAIGEAMLKIILVFAELERKMTAERVTAVMLSRANNGQWNGGHVPLGYKYDKKTSTFSIVEKEAALYHHIVELYLENSSTLQVANILNKEGCTSKRGNKWSPVSVHVVLTNVWYKGDYRYNRHGVGDGYKVKDSSEWITIENHHEPLISSDEFDKIQWILGRNKRGGNKKGETRKSKFTHVFAGLCICGSCGNYMTSSPGKSLSDGWRPSQYGCSSKRKSKGGCDSRFISETRLGPFIINLISNIMRAKGNVGPRTSISALQNKILRGEAFANVESINEVELKKLKEFLLLGNEQVLYEPPKKTADNSSEEALKSLMAKKRKIESSISRLTSLYLYGDDAISEKDYIIQKKDMENTLSEVDSKISSLQKESIDEIQISDDFIRRASFLILSKKLTEDKYICYKKFISSTEPEVAKHFVNTVISQIIITKGEVTKVVFTNGLSLSFNYKEETEEFSLQQ